jgi:hypothetical protein
MYSRLKLDWGRSSVVEHLHSTLEALGLISSTTKRKKKRAWNGSSMLGYVNETLGLIPSTK